MILDDIVEATRERVEKLKQKEPLKSIKDRALEIASKENEPETTFYSQLQSPGIHFICEVKKASPSKGIIASEFDYIKIAKEYEEIGAACISVLTEPSFFQGDNEYLTRIKQTVSIPVLRKDFIIDEYQIYEAKTLHADCILLIAAILDKQQLKEYIEISHGLHMNALVEVHDRDELKKALEAGASIIGVNNRNLKNFTVDITRALSLREKVPKDIVFIAESGVKTAEDVLLLKENRVNGVLIGETFMKSNDKGKTMCELTKLL
ncbi:MAG: indole-3-glycerol phosphate synthase TrpC [bacterium]|nr:indole-3-glycerol phosphate synthase TrpC [bacterium]